MLEDQGLLFRGELAPEGGLLGRVGDGGELRLEIGGLVLVTGRGAVRRGGGAGGGDHTGDFQLDPLVEIRLGRLKIRVLLPQCLARPGAASEYILPWPPYFP